jgi:hypothetical protein
MLLAKIKEKHAEEAKNIHIFKLSIALGDKGNSHLKDRVADHMKNPTKKEMPEAENMKKIEGEVENSPPGKIFQEIDDSKSGNK